MATTEGMENAVKRLLVSTGNRDELHGDQQQLNCRIDLVHHYQLGILADKFDMTRGALAAHLLEQATDIAWNTAGFGDLSDDDQRAIKALTKPLETPKRESSSDKVKEGSPSVSASYQSSLPPAHEERNNMLPDRSECFAVIFRHLGVEIGRIRKTVALSRDGGVRACCLTSKDYEAEKEMPVGERYWFTIYERHLEDIEQAKQAYVAFACGSTHQIVLVPSNKFREWCEDLPPYTQGNTGWHVHLSKASGTWNLRREGYRAHPIDVTTFVI